MAKFLFSTKSLIALVALCAALVLADFYGLRYDKVDAAEVPGFYAAISFATVLVAALAAKLIRPLIGRHESYYSEDEQTVPSKEEQSDV